MDATILSPITAEMEHVPIRKIRPSPENDKLYRSIDPADPEIIALAASIRAEGLLEPLVITTDGWILSGHRRYAAAKLAGLKRVPCRRRTLRRDDDPDEFVRLLREYNRQREKTRAEKLREEIVSINPADAYGSLVDYRRSQSVVEVKPITITGELHRSEISDAKGPMLDAAKAVIEERREYWPLTVRQIHYALLNKPPRIHASKPGRYSNTLQSYKALTNLLTRARLFGEVPMEAISDETRPVLLWKTHQDSRSFVRRELHDMFRGYWRDLMQSQPNHIELIGEKNTIAPILKKVAGHFCIPMTTGRGYCSLPPRHAIAERYRASGKDKLVLMLVSDFDPDGEGIAESFARSMRDDFGIDDRRLHPIKVALTWDQVREFNLPPALEAKMTSSRSGKFIGSYGKNAWELEALPPEQLQQVVKASIESVIDQAAFDAEVAAERRDAAFLEGVRRQVTANLGELNLEEEADQ